MPLDLKVDIHTTNDCRTLVIEDKTGNFAEDNLGGWGNFNVDPSIVGLVITIKMYYSVEGEGAPAENMVTYETDYIYQYSSDIANMEFPIPGSVKDFKFAVDVEKLVSDFADSSASNPIANLLTSQNLTEIPDSIYQIGITPYKIGGFAPEASSTFVFKNTCLTSKLVSKALTSVNLQCEDCDDRDLDKVLLAKSLLESLENL